MDLELIRDYAKKKMKYDATGHDFWHAERVAKLALAMYENEANFLNEKRMYIIEAASYLHDTIDDKLVVDTNESIKEVTKLLKKAGAAKELNERILYIMEHISFSKNIAKQYELPIEGQYVQDADRIDALGAIGIARAFAYGGHANDEIFNPAITTVDLESKEQYRKRKSTTINHFYEKLLKLETTMNTIIGRKIARERTERMKIFLSDFMREWSEQI